MLKKIINNTAVQIILGALVLWASLYIDSGSGVRWLLDAACNPGSMCRPILALAIVVFGTTLIIVMTVAYFRFWRSEIKKK